MPASDSDYRLVCNWINITKPGSARRRRYFEVVEATQEAGRLPASFLMGLVALLCGCGTDSSTEVTTGQTLDCAVFQTNVNNIFDQDFSGRTCSASGCHSVIGSSGGAFKIYPGASPNTVEMQANYLAAKGFANLNSPADSKLLLEPLAGAQSIVGSHAGGDIFTGGDTNYAVILSWISTTYRDRVRVFPEMGRGVAAGRKHLATPVRGANDGVHVQVAEPYLELHTGPGRGYPVTQVIERGE